MKQLKLPITIFYLLIAFNSYSKTSFYRLDYINDLKIDYVIELLKTENKYRNYTNKALAEEVGFGSTQNFTRAFKNRTDISPTYFVQKINEMP